LDLFAIAPIVKHAVIVEYCGRRIPTRRAQEIEPRRANKCMFELDSRCTIDGSARRNLARCVNHSCEPNAEAKLVCGPMMYRVPAPIAAGDEITIDYGEEYYDL